MRICIGLSAGAMLAVGTFANAQPSTQSTAQSTTAPSTVSTAIPPSPPSTFTLENPLPSQTPATEPESDNGNLGKVVVTSDLDKAREQIAPSLGAVTYNIGPSQIQNIPGGENAPFQQVLLRAPGVVEDSFGQEHVRGEHANLTYRVNGVLLPQPLNGFGQELDTRLIDSVTLITGSLPAQFGLHTAGVVDVTTKAGDTLNHNSLSLYGGSFDTFKPSVQFGGTAGKLDYFITASQTHNGIGIENPEATYRPLHDYTDQEKLFGYFSYRLDDTSRLSLLMNASYSDFQIPNSRNVPQSFDLADHPFFDSADLNETQNEQEYYTVVAYQKTDNNLSFQLSGFSRYGQITFDPDEAGDLIFNGVSSAVYNNFLTSGVQFDSSYIANEDHTIRAGLIADYTSEKLDTTTGVFAVDNTGAQTSDVPSYISDESGNYATESGIYLQDEWRLDPKLTLNYGLRYDRFDANFDTEDQLSPRANLVWKIDKATTAHIGYSRYFVPPPVQNVTVATVQKFAGTTNAPDNFLADPPRVERSNYYDIGLSRQLTDAWQVNVDGFFKQSRNLVDLGQFGQALILSPFNYKAGKVYGSELSSTYRQGGFSAYGNLSWVETRAHDIDSQQFQIDNAELDFISDHDIKLDHEAEFAGSGGVAYEWKNDRVYADILWDTGLRSGFANTGQVPPHQPVNIGYEHVIHLDSSNKHLLKLRVDVVNVFDEKYQIRDGSGIGVGAVQYGERLGVFGGISYEF